MFLLPPQPHFLEFQIWHYQKLLKNATDQKTIEFLASNISNFKKNSL